MRKLPPLVRLLVVLAAALLFFVALDGFVREDAPERTPEVDTLATGGAHDILNFPW